MSDETKIDWSPPMPDDQMAAAYQSVQAKLTHTAGGEVRNTLQNFVTALTHDPVFAGNIRRNLFKERMSMTCPVWWTRKSDMIDDMDVAFLRLYLEEHYGLRSEKLIYPALNIVSTAQAFHPVRDRLNSLVWDGVPRVRVALHHFLGAEVSDTNEKYLRTFMLGAANRVFYPGCKFELMLVLVGGYFLLASRMSPYLVDRYIMPLFPFVALLLALLLCLLGKKLTEISGWKEQIVGGMLVLLLVVVQGLRLAAYDGEYLYQGYARQEALAEEYEEFPCICVYAGVGYYENLPEFMHYTKTLLVTAEELKERKDTESVEALDRVIVLIKPGVDKEATVSVLRDKYGYTSEELLLSEGVHGDMIYMFFR